MEKNLLFCVDSAFQFIIATNLKMTLYKDEKADIIIYNSFKSAKQIYNNLNNKTVYENVYLADTVLCRTGKTWSIIKKLPKYILYLRSLVKPKVVVDEILQTNFDKKYDIFFFNGAGALPEAIFNTCKNNNPRMQVFRIEDGVSSGMYEYGKEKGKFRVFLERFTQKMFQNYCIEDAVKGYYLSNTEISVIRPKYKLIKSPQISRDNDELREFLNQAFDYTADKIDEKIIFFESGAAYFENNNEEVDLVEQLCNVFEPKDILIKMHPRRKGNRYQNLGVHVSEVSSVPWEIIQLNNNMNGKIFVSIGSGALFSSDIFFGDDCYKVFLYECMKHKLKTSDKLLGNYIKKYLSITKDRKVFIPESYKKLKEVLKSLL